MARFNKFGSIVKQAGSSSNASLYQSIRCMSSQLFIGGLSFNTNEQGVTQAFAHYGEVTQAKVVKDYNTGHSRGFGFVKFDSDEAANRALAMDGQDLDGRRIRVQPALDKPRGGGGNYGGYGGGGNYGGYGGGGNYNNGGGNYNNGGGNYNNGGGNYNNGGGNFNDGGNYNGGAGYGNEVNNNNYNGGVGDGGASPSYDDGFADSR